MKLAYLVLISVGLSSCASTAYNPSFIMGDAGKLEIKKESIAQGHISVSAQN